ncbi:MAG: heme exporter protein CcmB [Gammaproteobacteria bacterium]|nr:MAG: heme exporter protein CcmB [Gammaproteobacteria bacterium]
MKVFIAIIKRDLLLLSRKPADFYNPPLFFVLVIILYPFALGADSEILKIGAAGLVWISALLASILSLDNIFKADYGDGTLEEMVLSPHPLVIISLAKVVVYWFFTGLPLLLLSPILGLMMGLPSEGIWILMLSLLLGTPVLSLIGAIGAALTVGLKNGGVILSLLVLPLYIPVLIFGSSAVNNSIAGLDVMGSIYILSAFFTLSLVLAPLAIAASLKLSISN